ncbi:hypothetical protein SAURM35S_05912 [Streptomyces aurantiogriseus]
MTLAIDPSETSADPSPAPLSDLVARDAREFGVYARTGGWAFGLMVARSVRPGGQSADETPKVSAKEFAELAGCSPERVMRYYKAWDRAADDGLVPHFEELAPGQQVELPDADVWLTYYVSRSSATSERGTAITEAAEAEGIRPTKALEVAENPTALRAAILADPSTARAARAALLDRIKEDPELQTELARDVVRTDDLKKAVASESRSADRIGYVRQIAESGQIRTPAGQTCRRARPCTEPTTPARHLWLFHPQGFLQLSPAAPLDGAPAGLFPGRGSTHRAHAPSIAPSSTGRVRPPARLPSVSGSPGIVSATAHAARAPAPATPNAST